MKAILRFPFKVLSFIFGHFSWVAPVWLASLTTYYKRKPTIFWGVLVVTIIGVGGYQYYQTLPKPITVTAKIYTPDITRNHKDAKPDNLQIEFVYDYEKLNPDQERPSGHVSAARIDLVGEAVTAGVSLVPAKKGRWEWLSDNRLEFVPETDWPAGVGYKIVLDKSIFSAVTQLSASQYNFKTKDFHIDIDHIEFYQDPQDISLRRVMSTVTFTHPVDKASFEKRIKMTMRPSGSTSEVEPTSYNFAIKYDDNHREAYLISQPVTLPTESNYMVISIDDQVDSLFDGAPSAKGVEGKILIPDIYSFLKVSNADTQIIRNQNNEPEQVLMLEFTDEMEEKDVQKKLTAYLLPEYDQEYDQESARWALAKSEKLTLNMIPNEKNSSKLFNFILNVPENRQIYIKIEKGFQSVNKFAHRNAYSEILDAPNYPKEVDIVGDGSVLTYSGNHKLSVLTRGVPGLQYSIGRLLEGQLYHLISQTNGDIKNPDFSNWHFDKENIAETAQAYYDINTTHPKHANYASFDLSEYLANEKDRFGLFFIDVKGWDETRDREVYGANDSRLILITDLGIIVKKNADNTHDLFVQSIQTGDPVAGATVELLGKNGIALLRETTSDNGHVSLPDTTGYENENTPTVYVVKTDNDLSFIPYNRSSRQINISRFDIGGVNPRYYADDSLNAYVFTDRGIYRPGETINVGAIVKFFDLGNVGEVPLDIVVTGPRHNETKVSRVTLPEAGFLDFQYPTDATAETGRYQVSVHMVSANGHRNEEIGSADFKVEEFQPDTMKIESRLVGVEEKGWSTKNSLKANVLLKNLFGIPAQDRKTKGRLIIKPASFSFKNFKDYHFTDPYYHQGKKPLSLDEVLTTQQTDTDGKALFDIDLQRFREGTYRLNFIAEGFDQAGGRSVFATNSALISPLKNLIGYKTDGKLDFINAKSKRTINLIAINKKLNQVQLQGLRLKKIEIQKVSTLIKQPNHTYKYQTITKENELSENTLDIAATGYDYLIDTTEPGDFAIEVYDQDDKRLARLGYSVVGFGNLAGKIDKNAELHVKLNKKDYKPGEMIEMSIKAPYAGAGLITIENDAVRNFKWFKTSTESTIQSIKVPTHLEGTGYVNVAFVRDIGSKEIFTSPLSYAVQPFSIDKSQRTIDIDLDIAEIVRPGKPMKIGYSTSKASKIALFAVDEGILQVANYKTPNPLGHFLKKRSLDVETLQILDLILPDFDLLKNLSASGGGAGARKALAKNLNPFARKLDKPAVYWSGIIDADDTQQSVTFDVPDTFAGSLVVMAVAVGSGSMGVARDASIVRGPFVISPNVLTQVAPGDEFLVTVGVANLIEGSGNNADVSIDVHPSKHLEIIGDNRIPLKIDEGGENKVSFKVKAKENLGAATLAFTATHKNEAFTRTTGLSVRPAMPYYASFDSGFAESGNVNLVPKRTLYANLANSSVSASASPLVLVEGLTSYLDAFPHGCTEQVVSKVFPLVGLMTHPAYAPSIPYASHVPNVREHFNHAISKLRQRQQSNGGFAFWPGHTRSSEYPSIYVMHFLIEAHYLGYAVPADMLRRGKAYLKSYVGQSSASLSAARDRANAIYLLTRLGNVTTNYLVDLETYLNEEYRKVWRKDLLSAYMAATYQLLKKQEQAADLIDQYELGSQKDRYIDDFHSPLTQDAQYIFLLAKHFEQKAKALDGEQLLHLTDKIFKGEYNTLSSAYSILALGAYSKIALDNTPNEAIEFMMTAADAKEKTLLAEKKPFLTAQYPSVTKTLSVNGDKPLYYLNVQSGFDSNLPEQTVNEGIEIHRDFLDDKGNKLTTFKQGEEITVRLRVRALGDNTLTNIAVVDLLPGGFEVVRSSVSRTAHNWRAEYIDIREDRIVYYGSFDAAVKELTYQVKLTSAGDFVVPPSYAESMYDRSIRSISKWGRFNVTP